MSLFPNMNIVRDFRLYRTESLARYVTTESIPDGDPAALSESFRAPDVSCAAEESLRALFPCTLPACAGADGGRNRKRAIGRRRAYDRFRLIAVSSSTSC
jgi:hypothetical protein